MGLPLFINSQNSVFFCIEENNSTFIKSNNIHQGKISNCLFKNQIFFTHRTPVERKARYIYCFDLASEKYKTFSLEYNSKTKGLFTNEIFSFVILNGCAVFLTNDYIYTFSTQKKTWELKSTKKNNLNFNTAFPLNETEAFLYVNYNFHPGDADDKHLWANYSSSKDSIVRVQKMSDENVAFTPFVNSWISIYKGLIAYAHTTDYKIRFYDKQFHIVDSIHTPQLAKNKEYLLNQTFSEFSKDGIVSLQQFSDSTLTRIQKLFLLDSTTLIVLKKLPKLRKYEFDYWNKVGDKWILKKNEKSDGFYEQGRLYSSDQPICFEIFGNVNGIEVVDKKFYFIYYPYLPKISTPAFDRKKDYEDPVNEITRKDELYYGISKYKVSAP